MVNQRKKRVNFDYLSIVGSDGSSNDKVIKFAKMFDRISEEYKLDDYRYTFKIANTDYKLDSIKKPVTKDSYYHLVIEELRDTNLPSRSKMRGDSKPLDLTDDEFLGEKVSLLYDHLNHIFMLQINNNGISLSRLEIWFSSLLYKFNYNFDLRLPVIISKDTIKEVKSMVGYKMLNVRINNDFKQSGVIDNLFSIINQKLDKTSSNDYDLEIKLVAKKDNSDNEYLSDSIVHEVLTYSIDQTVEAFKVRGRDFNEKLETVNLLKNKIRSYVDFKFEKDRTLNPVRVFEEMTNKYDEEGKNKCVGNNPYSEVTESDSVE